MIEQERDDLLRRLEAGQAEMRADLVRIEGKVDALDDKVDALDGKVDALDDRVSDVARAVRELGGDVADDPPEEAAG